MLVDCHNHSLFSMDGKFSVEEMCLAAEKSGIEVFAITDHCDVNEWESLNLGETIPQSVSCIEQVKNIVPVKLLCGIELGEPLEVMEKTEYVLNEFKFDMVIGSIHNIKGYPDFYWADYPALSDAQIDEMLCRYFEELYEMAVWNQFDTLAHIGYPFRYIHADIKQRGKERILPMKKYEDMAASVFLKLIDNQKAFELNTASFTKSERDYFLNLHYLKLYQKLGGELITIGSDAHTPDRVGHYVREAYALLRELGFHSCVYYENRNPVFVPLS